MQPHRPAAGVLSHSQPDRTCPRGRGAGTQRLQDGACPRGPPRDGATEGPGRCRISHMSCADSTCCRKVLDSRRPARGAWATSPRDWPPPGPSRGLLLTSQEPPSLCAMPQPLPGPQIRLACTDCPGSPPTGPLQSRRAQRRPAAGVQPFPASHSPGTHQTGKQSASSADPGCRRHRAV